MMNGGFFQCFLPSSNTCRQNYFSRLLGLFSVLTLEGSTLSLQIGIQAWFPVSPAEFGKYVYAA